MPSLPTLLIAVSLWSGLLPLLGPPAIAVAPTDQLIELTQSPPRGALEAGMGGEVARLYGAGTARMGHLR